MLMHFVIYCLLAWGRQLFPYDQAHNAQKYHHYEDYDDGVFHILPPQIPLYLFGGLGKLLATFGYRLYKKDD